jgi:DNA-binding HxlR family transcriptional regulator
MVIVLNDYNEYLYRHAKKHGKTLSPAFKEMSTWGKENVLKKQKMA